MCFVILTKVEVFWDFTHQFSILFARIYVKLSGFFMKKWKLANFAAILHSNRTVIMTFLLNKKFEVTIESLLISLN